MTRPNGRFALIPLPEHGRAPADAIAVGPLSAATEPILSSQARDDAEELLGFVRNSVGELQRLAGGLAEQKQAHVYQVINDLCTGIAKMTCRLDAFTRREAERQRQARADARKAIEDSLPDPDTPDQPGARGAYPEPSLQPDLRASDPGEYPDDDGLAYDHPAELPEDAPRSDDRLSGDLPEEVDRAPPPHGTMPVWSPKDLKYPQEIPPTPSAVGGP
jgi:hypothetical protein